MNSYRSLAYKGPVKRGITLANSQNNRSKKKFSQNKHTIKNTRMCMSVYGGWKWVRNKNYKGS